VDFLLDVNASGAVARCLIDRGHDVAEVGQTDPRMSDDKILTWAVRERRIIVTTDNKFNASLASVKCRYFTIVPEILSSQ